MILEGTCGFRHLTPSGTLVGLLYTQLWSTRMFSTNTRLRFVWGFWLEPHSLCHVQILFELYVSCFCCLFVFFSILNRKIVKLLSKAVCIVKDCIYFLFCCSLLCTHSYLWCRRNSQDVGRAHASAVGVHEQQVWLLTQRWAGRQLLFSTRCQTFQSVVPSLVHPLPFPDKTMWKCQSEQALVIT